MTRPSNAIKYNLANGWIRIEAYRQGATRVLIRMINCSQEIIAGDSDRLLIVSLVVSLPAHAKLKVLT